MLDLNSQRWGQFRCSQGAASAVPKLLQALFEKASSSKDVEVADYESLFDLLLHQWTAYTSTVAAIPHIVRIVAEIDANSDARCDLLLLIGTAAICIRKDKVFVDDEINDFFDVSLEKSELLIIESLIVSKMDLGDGVEISSNSVRMLTGCYCAARGDDQAAHVLLEMHFGIPCPSCKKNINPFIDD